MFHLLVIKVVQTQQKNKAELSLQASEPLVCVHTDQPSFSELAEAQAPRSSNAGAPVKGSKPADTRAKQTREIQEPFYD